MDTTHKIFTLLLLIAISFSSCKKDKTDPNPNPNPAPANHLCNGNGSGSYFPLNVGNKWTIGGTTSTVTGDSVINGKNYFVLTTPGFSESYDEFFREDSNGDIYEYVVYSSTPDFTKDYLFMSGNPTVGQEWEFAPVFLSDGKLSKRKVTKTDAVVKTSKCDYKDLIEVKEYNYDGSHYATYYFKKGLGTVREVYFTPSDLTEVTLK